MHPRSHEEMTQECLDELEKERIVHYCCEGYIENNNKCERKYQLLSF